MNPLPTSVSILATSLPKAGNALHTLTDGTETIVGVDLRA